MVTLCHKLLQQDPLSPSARAPRTQAPIIFIEEDKEAATGAHNRAITYTHIQNLCSDMLDFHIVAIFCEDKKP